MCLRTAKVLGLGALALATLISAACQEATITNSNTTTTGTTTNVNSSNSANMTSTSTTTGAGTVIESKEPDKYTATMVVTAAASGQQQQAGKTEIKVARNGADRRYSVHVPVLGEVIFLDKADKRYLIVPSRKQYAELTPELLGFDAGRAMTPGQMVAYVSRQQGVELVGDETLNNRPATKYRVAGRTRTSTQAGEVAGESFIWVDKETGLPLRVEGFGQSTGNVEGFSGARAVVETRDLKTEANPSDFELPPDFKKLTPEELRQQTQALVQFAQGLMNIISAQAQASQAATPSAAATPAR
jgi:hypothetical protein